MPGDRKADDAWVDRLAMTIYGATPNGSRRSRRRGAGRGHFAGRRRRGDFAGVEPACCYATRAVSRSMPAGKCLQEACMATRSACMPPTRPTPGETSPGSATPAIHSPALIVAAFQNTVRPEHEGPLKEQPLPLPAHLEKITAKDAGSLLHDAEAAIKANDQLGAAALVHRYGELKLPRTARLRPAVALRCQRGRRVARREVLPDGARRVRHHPAGLPLASTGGPGPRDRQRIRAPCAWICRSESALEGVKYSFALAIGILTMW